MSFQRFLVVTAAVAVFTSALSGPSWGLQSCKCGPDPSVAPTAGVFSAKNGRMKTYSNGIADFFGQSGACVRMSSPSTTAGDAVPGVAPGGNLTQQQGDTVTIVK